MKFCSYNNCFAPNFSKDTKTGLPYCRIHQTKRTDYDRRTIIQKAIDKNKLIKNKVRSLANPTEKDNLLELWYMARRHQMVGYCTECGKTTNKYNEEYFKWSIAHICPKSIIQSVATHYHNWIELCREHHAEYDNTFERASKMKCFHEARLKFSYFKDLIPPEELRKVNPYLL